MATTDHNLELEQPYPLARNFFLRLFPALVLLLGGMVVLVGYVVKQGTENIYLERATRMAENIERDVEGKLPLIWKKMLSGQKLSTIEADKLAKTFAQEQAEYRLIGLKLYNREGRALYSHDPDEIGRTERGHALTRVIKEQQSSVNKHYEPDGSIVFELYVPFVEDDKLSIVFELYEPVDGEFQATVRSMIIPVVSTLFALLAVLMIIFLPLVKRAQKAITDRTRAVVDMRHRLERLLSRSAIETMRQEDPNKRGASQRTDMTLFYSDIRGFTSFCEDREPEQSIELLNQIVAVQLQEIEKQGGDVDKIIGDAILARFEGEGRQTRAVAAAIGVQLALAKSGLPLPVGIGIYSGPVVAGLLGSGERLDYTVIGDSVNISARLCSAAGPRQIVGDVATLKRAQARGFGEVNVLHVKGRSHAVQTRVWSPSAEVNAVVTVAEALAEPKPIAAISSTPTQREKPSVSNQSGKGQPGRGEVGSSTTSNVKSMPSNSAPPKDTQSQSSSAASDKVLATKSAA